MKKEFTIRDVKLEDGPQIIQNYYGYFEELKRDPGFGLLLPEKKPSMAGEVRWFADAYARFLEGKSVFLVAESDGKAVGVCDVIRKTSGRYQNHVGVVGLAVAKEYRGFGIGEALMREMIKKSRKKFDILTLGVLINNKGAFALYKKLGFELYGTLPDCIKRKGKYFGEHEMYMHLKRRR